MDELLDQICAVSEGNPGAVAVAAELVRHDREALAACQQHGLTGERLYLAHRLCGGGAELSLRLALNPSKLGADVDRVLAGQDGLP